MFGLMQLKHPDVGPNSPLFQLDVSASSTVMVIGIPNCYLVSQKIILGKNTAHQSVKVIAGHKN